MPRSYTLTAELIAANAGGPVVCLDPRAVGREFRAFKSRPGAERNRSGRVVLAGLRSEMVYGPQGVTRAEPEPPAPDVLVVDVIGPIEQRSGFHDPSGSWIDGHDAICERFCTALALGDVVARFDSPGGSVAGGPEHIRRVQEAKARYGRRVVVHTEACCQSMALWWALPIADEFYTSADGHVGSIGARGALGSIVGALAKDGIVVEVFEDPPGKASGVPERPIDDEARGRAQEEITAAADMFRAAVCDSAIGRMNGITPDALKAMRGRSYQGQQAVAMGLATGVASLEDVLAMALATAGEGATMDPEEPKDKPESANPEGPDAAAPKCARCEMALDPKDAFCSKCGTATVPPEDDEPDSDPKPGARHAPGGGIAARYATLSVPALRAACITMHGQLDAVARHVGAKAHAEIVGAAEATAHDAKNAIRFRSERDTERKASNARERIDILHALAAADPTGHPRGKLLMDVVENLDAHGNVIPAADKNTPVAHSRIVGTPKPAKLWGDGPEGRSIENLRGYARTVLDAMPAAERNPFERPAAQPDVDAAATGTDASMTGEIEAAKRDPVVQLAARTTPGASLDDIARSHVLATRAARRAQVPA